MYARLSSNLQFLLSLLTGVTQFAVVLNALKCDS